MKIHVCGNGEPAKGLAAEVCGLVAQLQNIELIRCGRPRGYKGEQKIRIPTRWTSGHISVVVCDTRYGERVIDIHTTKPGAIARIMRKKLGGRRVLCE